MNTNTNNQINDKMNLKDMIVADYVNDETLSLSDIGEKYNTTRQNVSHILISMGYSPNERYQKQLEKVRTKQQQKVIKLLTVETLADDIGVIFETTERNYISSIFKKMGISLYDLSMFRRLFANYQIKFLQNIPNLPRSEEADIDAIIALAKEKILVDITNSTIHEKLLRGLGTDKNMVVSFKNMADVLNISVSYVQKNIYWLEDFIKELPENETTELAPIYDTLTELTEEKINSLPHMEKIIQLSVFSYKMLTCMETRTEPTPLSFEYLGETYTIDKPIGEYIVEILGM